MAHEINTHNSKLFVAYAAADLEKWKALVGQPVIHARYKEGLVVDVSQRQDGSIRLHVRFEEPPAHPKVFVASSLEDKFEISLPTGSLEPEQADPTPPATARCHTSLPRRTDERSLAKKLAAFHDPRLHLWFGIDFVPGVRDVDLLLWHEAEGVFLIEINAVGLDSIASYSWEKIKLRDRKEADSPPRQADRAVVSLRNFLMPQMQSVRPPSFLSTACWPLITRDAWNRRWDDKRITGEYAERMIFKEDIERGIGTFIHRLRVIQQNPPVGQNRWNVDIPNAMQLERVQAILAANAKKKAPPSDLHRLRIIEDKINWETRQEIPPGGGTRFFFHGYPGSGKTIRLLQIGAFHAFAGCNVLYSCFNNVLATDINRLLSYSQRLPLAEGSILTQDVIAIANEYAAGQPPKQPGSYDEWGRAVLEDMKSIAGDLPKYDTILIDEAQAMTDWALEMLALLSATHATICVAGGRGQAPADETTQWLQTFARTAQVRRLNRSSRHTRPVGRLAHVFYDAAMDTSRIKRSLKRFPGKPAPSSRQQTFLQQSEGQLPNLVSIGHTGPEFPEADRPKTSPVHLRPIIDDYKRIIQDQIDRLSADERPLDLLILVPNRNSPERNCALKAIDELGLVFIDYTKEEYRRHIAQPEMVRIYTFHGARGIQGSRAVIFGIEQLEDLVQEVGVSLPDLGYITLSRANIECAICVRPTVESKVVSFIESGLQAMRAA